jgi:hypothetical protein
MQQVIQQGPGLRVVAFVRLPSFGPYDLVHDSAVDANLLRLKLDVLGRRD